MKRREFLTVLGGAATIPLAARAQEQVRRVGVLMAVAGDDPAMQAYVAAFHQGLQEAGWVIGRNVRIDVRWSAGDLARLRKEAAELVANSEVIVAGFGPSPPALQQATRTVPVVFAQTVDPVGGGFVQSLARPGGNMTGFLQFEYSLSGKWFELLKEITPRVSRIGVVRDLLGGPAGAGQWAVIQAFASPLGVETSPINLAMGTDAEHTLSAFAPGASDGLIVTVSSMAAIHRQQIVTFAALHRLPAIYSNRFFVEAGGLVSYGTNLIDNYRRTATYVDRILKGAKPADLPVQAPTKYELVINLKTAKALGLTIPPSVLARADEVIE
jgi:ABC-type uncharacterized transport system substrate-binding protein